MRNIKGYEGLYAVTEDGRIWSSRRKGSKGHFLKQRWHLNGYEYITLSKNCLEKNFRVHRLVAITFIPNPKNLPQVNHIDGNKRNNRVENLEWCTNLQNRRHGIRIGVLDFRGERASWAKLSSKEVIKIRAMSGLLSHKEMAHIFNVNRATITYIIRRKTWKNI